KCTPILIFVMGDKKFPCAMPPPIIQNIVMITPLHRNTLILPIVSIFLYNKNIIKTTTPPLTILSVVESSGTRKEKYFEKPIAAEAITNGACIIVCQTNKKLIILPASFLP